MAAPLKKNYYCLLIEYDWIPQIIVSRSPPHYFDNFLFFFICFPICFPLIPLSYITVSYDHVKMYHRQSVGLYYIFPVLGKTKRWCGNFASLSFALFLRRRHYHCHCRPLQRIVDTMNIHRLSVRLRKLFLLWVPEDSSFSYTFRRWDYFFEFAENIDTYR